MTDQLKAAKRDEVLFAFHRDCDHPTVEQIIAWTERYPEFAEDIRAHAAIRLDWAADNDAEYDQPDELMLARGHSRALNAIYIAQVAQQAEAAGEAVTFQQLMAASGTTIPQLARELGIERGILADLVGGRMLAPVGRRLVEGFGRAIQATGQKFERALRSALAQPTLGHAKADRQPTVVARPYADIIRSSSMSDERRAYWLGED